MPIIHAEVDDDTYEYLEEWADAVGAEVYEVAGDAIFDAKRRHEAENDREDVTVDPIDDGFPGASDHSVGDNPRMADPDDGTDAKTLSDYAAEVPKAWCARLGIPRDTTVARQAYDRHPIFHAAVQVAARNATGDPDEVTQEDVDAVLRGDVSRTFRIPVSLLSGVGHDPEETAEALSGVLDEVARGGSTDFGGHGGLF